MFLFGVFIFVIIIVAVFVVVIVLKKKDNIRMDNEFVNEIPVDRVNCIKDKYKAIEKIKKMKRVTKEDVEEFYKSQINGEK